MMVMGGSSAANIVKGCKLTYIMSCAASPACELHRLATVAVTASD